MRTTRHQTRCRVGRMFPSNGALTQVGLTLACVLVVLAMTSLGHAQATATVEGLVADSTGAVLPRAQVVATSLATGLARSTDANSDGYYRMASLPVGAYDITVTLTGFKKTLLSGVVFTVGQVARVDVTMQVGDVQQEVTVEGTALGPLGAAHQGEDPCRAGHRPNSRTPGRGPDTPARVGVRWPQVASFP